MSGPRIPRTLLLTWQRPDGRYAGAEAIRKIVAALPPERLRWAYLDAPARQAADGLPQAAAFEPRRVHWRLRNSLLGYLFEHHAQAGALARRIAAWSAAFRPEALWVLAEMGAVTVGRRLRQRLGVPLHATVHDAYEFARLALPRRYEPLYRRSARRLLAECASLDAVSAELIARLREFCPPLKGRPALVFPSSARRAEIRSAPPPADGGPQALRRLALCGSLRIDEWQWREFLAVLAGQPWPFEILAWTDRGAFFSTPAPANVRLRFQPYAASEADVIRELAGAGVWACYLGVSRAPQDAAFSRYSLSSKLTAYAAAGLPTIVDAPAASAVWRLVGRYEAGALFDGSAAAAAGLRRLLADPGARERLGAGALRLCRAELELETNLERWTEALSREAAR